MIHFPTSLYGMGFFIETPFSSITFEKSLTPLQNQFLNIYLTLKNIAEAFKLQLFALNDTFSNISLWYGILHRDTFQFNNF